MKDLQVQEEAFHNLSYYTLSHKSPEFIHQYIVDAYSAQTADKNTKSIKITFALIGLYLHLEKNFTGKEVQNAHVLIAKKKREWPKFTLPKNRGEINVFDVLNTQEGTDRDKEINNWSMSVWRAYGNSKEKVEKLLKEYNLI